MTPDTPVPLAKAVELFFPHGGATISTLRTEARKGRLTLTRIGNRDFVTQQDAQEMPARSKGVRPYLRRRKGREPVWVIKDGPKERVIGPGTASREEIERALGAYIGEKHRIDLSERNPANIQVSDVLTYYAENFAIHHACPKLVMYHMNNLLPFWGNKSLADVKGATCRMYISSRAGPTIALRDSGMCPGKGSQQFVKPSTARRELETLQAAINVWHKESPLDNVPRLTLPPKGVPRQRFLERREAAALLKACRRLSRRRVPIGKGGYKQEDFSYVARFVPFATVHGRF